MGKSSSLTALPGILLVEQHEQFAATTYSDSGKKNYLLRISEKLRDLPCHTSDGKRFSLWVNTGLRQDTARSLRSGAEAVGLFPY